VKPQTVEPLWKEFRKCYPTEKAALAAARRNVAVLLPFINTADNIRFNYQILCNELGFDEGERLNILSKNHLTNTSSCCANGLFNHLGRNRQ
jgi:hypothetical protein